MHVRVAPLSALLGGSSSSERSSRGVFVIAALLEDGSFAVWLYSSQMQVLVRSVKAHDAPMCMTLVKPFKGMDACLLSAGCDGEVKLWRLKPARAASGASTGAALEMASYFFAGGVSPGRELSCVVQHHTQVGCGFSDGMVELWKLPLLAGTKGVGSVRARDCGYEIHATSVVCIASGQPDVRSNCTQLMTSAADGDVVLWSGGIASSSGGVG